MYLDMTGASWRVIAGDAGLLQAPYAPNVLRVASGERYDIEVSWTNEPGQSGAFRNLVPTVVDGEVQTVPIPMLTLQSNGYPALSPSKIHLKAEPVQTWDTSETTVMDIELNGANVGGMVQWMINGKTFDEHTPIEVQEGSRYILRVENKVMQEHPFHLHGHFFRVISRNGLPPEAQDRGMKDTVYVGGQDVLELAVEFDNPGGWMMHCHIQEHAELGMMAIVEVNPI